MMKTAQSPRRNDVGSICRAAFDCSFVGSALVQANVSPVLMMVANVAPPKSPKMMFIERNDMVEQFATRAAHPSFRRSVLPGAPNARAQGWRSLDLKKSRTSFPNLASWSNTT